MIDRHFLDKEIGGFKLLKTKAQPEVHIAARLSKANKYQFVLSRDLGVSYEKSWSTQVNTAIRVLYPMFGGKLLSNIVMLIFLMLLNTPSIVLLTASFDGWMLFHWVAVWQLCMFMAIYGLYVGKVWSRAWWFGGLLWPLVVFQELVILIISIYRNLTHSVTWKGRPISKQGE